MFYFLLKIWGLAKKYRLRLAIGVVTGILSGLMQPLLIGTIFFVVSAVFPDALGTQTQPSVSKLPQFLQVWFTNVRDVIKGNVGVHRWEVWALVASIPLIM